MKHKNCPKPIQQKWEAWIGENGLARAWNDGDEQAILKAADRDNLSDRDLEEMMWAIFNEAPGSTRASLRKVTARLQTA